MAERSFGPLLLARVSFALIRANVRYWSTVAPAVRVELERWRVRAAAIPDPHLRALALAKLDAEAFNAEAGAMLATLAPRRRRRRVVEAIVALQVLFDLLDGLTEEPSADPLGEGQRLFSAFTGALYLLPCAAISAPAETPAYLRELSSAASAALESLPARAATADAALESARRAAEAQIRMHASRALGIGVLQSWAEDEALVHPLPWRELAAGSASAVLAIHALSAAAAYSNTEAEQAEELAAAYLSICVLLTLLDSLTDLREDDRADQPGYVSLYDDRAQLASALSQSAEHAVVHLRRLPRAPEHLMILTGVVAYYGSTVGARSELARPLLAALRSHLGPALIPALFVMRSWRRVRAAHRAFSRRRLRRAGPIS